MSYSAWGYQTNEVHNASSKQHLDSLDHCIAENSHLRPLCNSAEAFEGAVGDGH